MVWLVFGSLAVFYSIVLISGRNVAKAKEAWADKYPEYLESKNFGYTMSLIELVKFAPKH